MTDSHRQFVAGDTVELAIADASYRPGSGWGLTLVLLNARKTFSFAGSDDGSGSGFTVALTAAESRDIEPGDYALKAVYANGAERHTTDAGMLSVLPDFQAQGEGYDLRTQAQRILDSLLAAKERLVAGAHRVTVNSESVGGRSRSYRNLDEIDAAIRRAQRDVNVERQAARAKQGLGHRGRVKVRL